MVRVGGFVVVLLGIVALTAILLMDLPSALGAVDLMIPEVGAIEYDLGTALITVAAVLVFIGLVEAARPRAR
jgi:hypothetical protein